MSADKRKRFYRACELLREINTGVYIAPSLSNHRGRFGLKNPVIRYIVARGLAKIVRKPRYPGPPSAVPASRHTLLETGFPWARPHRRV